MGSEMCIRDRCWVCLVGFDIWSKEEHGNISEISQLIHSMEGCDGVIHLAATTKVLTCEREPHWCRAINVIGTQNVLDAALQQPSKPWVLFASSREVYGQAALPVVEDTALKPLNTYGLSKALGEHRVLGARDRGLCTGIFRLANVYGAANARESNRVIPAFINQARQDRTLRVDDPNHTIDFTHIADVTEAIARFAMYISAGLQPPPIHFVSGQQTNLVELAEMIIELAFSKSQIKITQPRGYDVMQFVGDPARAYDLLGWKTTISLKQGIEKLLAM